MVHRHLDFSPAALITHGLQILFTGSLVKHLPLTLDPRQTIAISTSLSIPAAIHLHFKSPKHLSIKPVPPSIPSPPHLSLQIQNHNST
jgi:hypothetical protein